MKKTKSPMFRLNVFVSVALLFNSFPTVLNADPAPLLFADEFDGQNPSWAGWTAVQPPGNYFAGPMLWLFNNFSQTFSEDSNIYTDSATFSSSRISPMLINDTVTPSNFTYTARLTAADDDAFGLIWGYQNENTFYRVAFARQVRNPGTAWPNQGWIVDRANNSQITDIARGNNFVNTIYRPFDVTLVVTNNLLTLTVVDDPDGVPTPYTLVTDSPLPTSSLGQVGIFTWGQNGNGGFRIGNPVLTPTPLTGMANQLSNTWTSVITPRSNGTTNLNSGISPDWSLGIDASGNRGWLVEHSDAFQSTDNVAAGTTNYAAPTLLAGDPTWSNYVYYARMMTGDDDGFGLVFRYLNETNFYRIGFRNQNSQAGIRRGWSIQKCVNLVFDQIAAGNNFIPPLNVPIDVYVAMRTNRLSVFVISNPLGSSAQNFTFGPFDITGSTVDQGKIGILSWAQSSASGTQVDFARVYESVGETLFVNSPFGTPNPPPGVNNFPISSTVTASVENVVLDVPDVQRRVNNGWSGFGSVPVSGNTNQAIFPMNSLSSISWLWRTEYFLTIGSTAGGTASSSLSPWVPNGSNVTATATADSGYVFTGWSGDSISSVTNLTFAMTRPTSLTANFAVDSDNDGLPDSWEVEYFGNLGQGAAGQLPDNDGVSNLEEFRRGTDPTFVEALVVSDGLSSKWINPQRDPALPGQLGVVDFGSGYRGAFDESNDSRNGNDYTFIASTNDGPYASWQSPRVIVRSDLWDTAWETNFSASMELSVGDNDASSLYFRYQDEKNWYRVTVCGEDPLGSTARPPVGLSIQRRLNGKYDTLATNYISGPFFAAFADPSDGAGTPAGFKKMRITVNATNENFEVRVAGWNFFLTVPDFDSANELIETFTDTNHVSGRIGFGLWGMNGFGNNQNQTNGIPIPTGGFVDNIVLKSPADGSVVFSEDWETAPLTNEFPAGWSNAYGAADQFYGDWRMSAHGTIMQESNVGLNTTGSDFTLKADADGPVLLAPNQIATNYLLQIGIQSNDDDGVGVVYDFVDTNNYARVMLVAEASGNGRIPQGLSISRKSDGVWSDIIAGDQTFVFTQGRPFGVQLANNNGAFHLLVQDLDNPANVFNWSWTDTASTVANRFGLTTWASTDAHFLYARALSLPTSLVTEPLEITNVSLSGGNIILDISKPAGSLYDVLKASFVEGPYNPVATNQSGSQYSETAPTSTSFYQLRLVP